ncbi:MAG TPA: tetratricopeptide repeat protein [Myxococcaceae bacterium]|nr:tetratricopeptide repeat protein [Myxococcaceae bacterium]
MMLALRHLAIAPLVLWCACASPPRARPTRAVATPGDEDLLPTFRPSLLKPSEIFARLEKSPVIYKFETQPRMVPMETQRNARAFWPEQNTGVEFPVLEVGANGARSIRAYVPSPRIERLLREAEPAFQARDYLTAEKRYEEALRIDPTDYLALLGWGDAAFFRGDAAVALERYVRASRANPSDHRSWYYRGNALVELDRGADALDAYARALALRPRHAPMLDGIEVRAKRLGVRLRVDLFSPRASVIQNDDGSITIRTVPEPHWVAYGACKALWMGEPSRRKEVLGTEEHPFTTMEETECLATLVILYAAVRQGGDAEAEPALDRLLEIAEAGLLDAFILYELGTRIWAHAVLMAPNPLLEEVAHLVRHFLLTPIPMGETTAGSPHLKREPARSAP